MSARRLSLAALAAAVAAAAVACEESRPFTPPKAPSFEEEIPHAPAPTPFPLRGGTWRIAVAGTGSRCGLDAPPSVAYLDGARTRWQLASEPDLLDAAGLWDGTNLALAGSARRTFRPTTDCVLEDEEVWRLSRSAAAATVATSLEGTVSFARAVLEGNDCDAVSPPLPRAVVLGTGATPSPAFALVHAPATALKAEGREISRTLRVLDRGTILRVRADDGLWAKVDADGTSGHVRSSDITPACVASVPVRLRFASADAGPHLEPVSIEATRSISDVARDPLPRPTFTAFTLDPDAEPTSAPDLLEKSGGTHDRTPAPGSRPTPDRGGSGKKRTRGSR